MQLFTRLLSRNLFSSQTLNLITFAIRILSRYMARPQKHHFEATKHIFKYINITVDFGILYHHGRSGVINNFIDVN